MELKQAVKEIKKGKIIVDEKGLGGRFFLFGRNDIIYYVNDHEINDDKMELAIKNNNRPSLLAEAWWESKWEIYEKEVEKTKIDKIIYNAVKGIKSPSKEEIEVFDNWYKKEFGEVKSK